MASKGKEGSTDSIGPARSPGVTSKSVKRTETGSTLANPQVSSSDTPRSILRHPPSGTRITPRVHRRRRRRRLVSFSANNQIFPIPTRHQERQLAIRRQRRLRRRLALRRPTYRTSGRRRRRNMQVSSRRRPNSGRSSQTRPTPRRRINRLGTARRRYQRAQRLKRRMSRGRTKTKDRG